MTDGDRERIQKRRIAAGLEEPVREARRLAEKLGLDPYPVNYWIVDHDEMNELIAYDGFQTRYPHWRFGMKYDRQRKQRQFLGGKAFEIVNNDDPSHAFLQESNARADQKAVITHVEGHADFFNNNQWFGLFADDPDAAAMLEAHADRIEAYMSDPEVDREAVEAWIDNVLCLEDCIDQHRPFTTADELESETPDAAELQERLDEIDVSDEVLDQVFDDEWIEAQRPEEDTGSFPAEPERDLLSFLRTHGMAYDGAADRAVEFEDWQREVVELLRREAYYFAPQKMTKTMNEGWAAYHESLMMGDEGFADVDEFVHYADHQARVLNSPGFNPYKLGKQLWEYIENTTNRREVVDKLLRVEGISWRNVHDTVDLEAVLEALEPDPEIAAVVDHLDSLAPDDPRVDADQLAAARDGEFDVERYPWRVLAYEGMAERHYSLVKPQHRGFLSGITQADLERIARYMFDDSRYDSVDAALAAVDRTAGWDRMREVRESHNDVTFLDEFLTQEFVNENDYFTYEYTRTTRDYRVTSTDYEDVKKKLMLRFTNFGKPTVVVEDGNYNNRNELLLAHEYNGVMLDLKQAQQTLERVFELWGRPVNLKTIVKQVDEHDVEVARRRDREPDPDERGKLLRYDGDEFAVRDLPWEDVEHLAATDIDYDTKPDDWLA